MKKIEAVLLCVLFGVVAALLAPPTHAQVNTGGIRTRAVIFNGTSPGNATNIITKDTVGASISGGIVAIVPAAAWRVTVCLATGSVFNAVATDGKTSITMSLNGGTALTAGAMYTFVFGASKMAPTQSASLNPAALTWNFQVATTGTINLLQVDEVTGAAD